MASITQKEVEHVAHLAKLELTEAEKSRFAEQLSHILTYVDQLQEVSTEGVTPTASGTHDGTVLREDIPQQGLSLEHAVANAPESSGGFFVVPKILGK
jgi:aspartyl-tRNA(Asn)/glutamyl-tRNA(Gln) amidotransferase subunit C